MRNLVYIVATLLLLAPSISTATSSCASEGLFLEGELVNRFRQRDGSIRTQAEIDPLRNYWGLHDPIYSSLILRTRESRWPEVQNARLYVRIGTQEFRSYALSEVHQRANGQVRARFENSSFQPIQERLEQTNANQMELSIRNGDEILCVHNLRITRGD